MNVPKVAPRPSPLDNQSDLFDEFSMQPNGNYGVAPTTSAAANHFVKTRKPGFHGSFKQAVFMNRGNEDGTSTLQVSFMSDKAKTIPSKVDLTKQPVAAGLLVGSAAHKTKPKVGKSFLF